MGNKRNKIIKKPKACRKLQLEKCASMNRSKNKSVTETLDNSDSSVNNSTEQEIQYVTLENIAPDVQFPLTLPDKLNMNFGNRETTQSTNVLNTGLETPGSSMTSQEKDYTFHESDEGDTFLIEAVENNEENNEENTVGRRIIDVHYFLRQLQEKARHNKLFDCKEGYFKIIGETKLGLLSKFKLQCSMCQEIVTVCSENISDIQEKKSLSLNLAATTGIIATGIGHSQFEELFSAMDIPVFSTHTYTQLQNEVYKNWELTAVDAMQAAIDKEKEIAISESRTKDGYPVIDVYADGAWSARSYGTNFKALSGAAAIIGRRTGAVLYMGVRNKYCLVCSRADKKNISPVEHTCFKNFDGSSTSMEAEIIAEGFKTSIPMYGVIYKRLIADGDSSTYARILKVNPYQTQNVTVEKIECRNHILRNFCKKLRNLAKDTKFSLAHRKTLSNHKIMAMRKIIVKSIKYHHKSNAPKNDAVSELYKDITHSVEHAYGDHRMCHDYNCGKDGINGDIREIQNTSFLFRMNSIVATVAGKSRSLIENVDTNTVERFNNVIAKFVGGKRVNFALRHGYQARCAAAVVSFNKKTAISSVQKRMLNKSPRSKVLKDLERKRAKKRKLNLENPVKKMRKFRDTNHDLQHDYGQASSAPDMPDIELERAKDNYLENLKNLTYDRDRIERSTVLQRDSSEWLEIRKKIITASNFGPICKRKLSTDTSPLVKNILYKKNLSQVASIAHGVENEKQALQQIEQQLNIKIDACGLFIDKKYPFIGATPDGLVGHDMLVEVKCSLLAAKLGLQNALETNKIQLIRYNKKTKKKSVNKNSNWFYQIQGQLHVTGRQKCIFGLWISQSEPVHIEYIEKDDQFWDEKMEQRLIQFYSYSLLPELVDPRHTRGMPIRNIVLREYGDDKENIVPSTSSIDDLNLVEVGSKVISFENF